MKKLALAILLSFPLFSNAKAQVGFEPSYGEFSPSAIGSKIILQTTFLQPTQGAPTIDVLFVCDPGVTVTPSGLEECAGCAPVPITLTFDTDKAGCYGPLAVQATEDSGVTFTSYFFGGYIYDPKIIGRVQLQNDTLNFGQEPIGTDDSLSVRILIDTFGSTFRKLLPLNIYQPFFTIGSITPGIFECETISNYFHFQPAEVKHYIDTTYLYDPIRKDSTMLILIGEGVAAGVAESTADESALQVYPNPCDRFANIVLPSQTLEQVEIRNALGAIVQSFQGVNSDFTFDASSLPNGVYFIEARTGDAIVTKRLVVMH